MKKAPIIIVNALLIAVTAVAEEQKAASPPPKPVPNAPNVKKAEGITYIGKYKKFHAEFKTGGRTINVGLFDTEKEAIKALNREKAEYNL